MHSYTMLVITFGPKPMFSLNYELSKKVCFPQFTHISRGFLPHDSYLPDLMRTT